MNTLFTGIDVSFDSQDFTKNRVIYCLTFPSGKNYIGQTSEILRNRIQRHCAGAFYEYRENYGSKKCRAIRKYKAFKVSVLYECKEEDNINEWEIYFIKKYNTYNAGYNSTIGGEGTLGYHLTEETKKKISEAHKGKTVSEETKAKMSIRMKDNNYSKDRPKELLDRIAKARQKKVLQFSLEDEFTKEWDCSKTASEYLGIDKTGIARVCRGLRPTAGGYKWKYKTN